MSFQNPDTNDVQQLVERFAGAHWIKGVGRMSAAPFAFVIEWSDVGRDRMTQVRLLLKKYRPELFDESARSCGFIGRIRMELRFRRITRALRPPEFSGLDYRTILGIALTSHEDPHGLIQRTYTSDLE